MFSISAKTKYALTALIELSSNGEDKPVQLKNISDKHGIPFKILEQVMIQLRKANLVSSVRGTSGGYKLKDHPRKINILTVMKAIEGSKSLIEGHQGCSIINKYLTYIENKVEKTIELDLETMIKEYAESETAITYHI